MCKKMSPTEYDMHIVPDKHSNTGDGTTCPEKITPENLLFLRAALSIMDIFTNEFEGLCSVMYEYIQNLTYMRRIEEPFSQLP